jgi:hypothetical protein
LKKRVFVLLVAVTLLAILLIRLDNTSGMPEETFFTYAASGVFGPVNGTENIAGDVHITNPDIHLRNMNIAGNLYIAKSVTDGKVRLKGVSVAGAVVVLARGETSLTLHDAEIADLTIGRTDGKVQIFARGATTVKNTKVYAEAELFEENLTADGFLTVSILGPEILFISADVKLLQIKAGSAKPFVQGIVDALLVSEGAMDCRILLSEGTRVRFLEMYEAATIQGPGTVEDAQLHADGSVFENPPQNINAAENVIVRTGIVSDDEENEDGEDTPNRSLIIYKIDSVALLKGQAVEIPVTTAPSENVTIQAASGDPGVATVDVSGMTVSITALSPGTSRITVTALHPELSGAGAAFTVSVILPKVAAPGAAPAPGVVSAGTQIALSTSTSQAAIYYTTDGSQPTPASTLYSGENKPVVTAEGLTLRAMAVKEGMAASDTVTFSYAVTQPETETEDDNPENEISD